MYWKLFFLAHTYRSLVSNHHIYSICDPLIRHIWPIIIVLWYGSRSSINTYGMFKCLLCNSQVIALYTLYIWCFYMYLATTRNCSTLLSAILPGAHIWAAGWGTGSRDSGATIKITWAAVVNSRLVIIYSTSMCEVTRTRIATQVLHIPKQLASIFDLPYCTNLGQCTVKSQLDSRRQP